MEAFNKELPKFRDSLEQSRKVVAATRQALAKALEQAGEDRAGAAAPAEHLARLADDLPQLIGELAKVLRETSKLKEIAAQCAQAEKGIDVGVDALAGVEDGAEASRPSCCGQTRQAVRRRWRTATSTRRCSGRRSS